MRINKWEYIFHMCFLDVHFIKMNVYFKNVLITFLATIMINFILGVHLERGRLGCPLIPPFAGAIRQPR